MSTSYVLATIIIMSLVTFATRAFPFYFAEKMQANPLINYLGKMLPPSIMFILLIYCLKDTSVVDSPYGIPELLAITLITILHISFRSALISIGAGTTLYMFLVN